MKLKVQSIFSIKHYRFSKKTLFIKLSIFDYITRKERRTSDQENHKTTKLQIEEVKHKVEAKHWSTEQKECVSTDQLGNSFLSEQSF